MVFLFWACVFIIIVLVWQRLLLGFKECLETRGNQMIRRQRLSSYLGFSSIGKVLAILLIHVEMVWQARDENKRRREKISKKEDKFNFYCLVGLGYEIYLFFLFVSFLFPHFLPTLLFVFFQTKDNTKFIFVYYSFIIHFLS